MCLTWCMEGFLLGWPGWSTPLYPALQESLSGRCPNGFCGKFYWVGTILIGLALSLGGGEGRGKRSPAHLGGSDWPKVVGSGDFETCQRVAPGQSSSVASIDNCLFTDGLRKKKEKGGWERAPKIPCMGPPNVEAF